MKKVVKLKESDLLNIIKKVVSETNIVKDRIKPSPYNPKVENEEFDDEVNEESDWRKGCCRANRPCRGTSEICQNCQCVPRHDWGK